MFKNQLCRNSIKICTIIFCGSYAYKYNILPKDYFQSASGFNYSKRFYSASSEYPDVTKNKNLMARSLTKEMYAKLRDLRTPNGFTFDDAIQTGINFLIIF